MKKATIMLCAVALALTHSAAMAEDITIDQVGQQFDPKKITVKINDTLVFKNGDDVTHNVSIDTPDGKEEDMGLQKPGESLSKTVNASGDYAAHCQIHPKMKMKIKVE